MDLIMIGKFETVAEAEDAVSRMEALKVLADAEWSDDSWQSKDERMPESLREGLMSLELYDMGRFDVDNYAYEHSISRDGSNVRIWTEESDVQGFLKVLINLGARVDVFSRHDWNEDGTPATEADN
jgi:hypothetical protein